MEPLWWLGLALVLLGVALMLVPVAVRVVDAGRIPPLVLYVYRSDGFYFVTSPLLLLLSLFFLLLYFVRG